MTSPVVSVIITCCGDSFFLRDALESVRPGSLSAEIVVVEDGSSGDVAGIVERFERQCPAIRVHHGVQTLGAVSTCRNRGLVEARGKYVVFLESTDVLLETALEAGAQALDSHPLCAFVFGRCGSIGGERVPRGNGRQKPVADHYRELLKKDVIGSPAAVMFRREEVERAGGFDPSLEASASYDLYLKLSRHYHVLDHGQTVARCAPVRSQDAAVLLRDTLTALRRQRPFLEDDAASLAAYHEGIHRVQETLGSALAEAIAHDAAANRWAHAARKVLVLAEEHPAGLAHQAIRRVRVFLPVRWRARQPAR